MTAKNIYAIIDTETAGSIASPLMYDCAVIIFERDGKELYRKNWLIKEVWDNTDLFNSAYYAYKRPLYDNIPTHKVNMMEFVRDFNDTMTQYGVTHLLAYNLKFDLRAMENTSMRFIQGKFLREYQLLDVWGMSCELLFNSKNFKQTARENGWVSEKGNYRTSAEIAYRYITNDNFFDEAHTAMSDCEIEKEIFITCLNKKKSFTKQIINNPWKLVQDQEAINDIIICYCNCNSCGEGI